MAQDLPVSDQHIELDSLDQGSTGSSTPSEIQVDCFRASISNYHQHGTLNAALLIQEQVYYSKWLCIPICLSTGRVFAN